MVTSAKDRQRTGVAVVKSTVYRPAQPTPHGSIGAETMSEIADAKCERSATACIADTSIPNSPSGRCQKFARCVCSAYISLSQTGAQYIVPFVGNTMPPGLTQCKRQVRVGWHSQIS